MPARRLAVRSALLLGLALSTPVLAANPQYVVLFHAPSLAAAEAARAVEQAGGTVHRDLSQAGIVVASSGAPGFADALAHDPAVRSVQHDRLFPLAAPPAPALLEGEEPPVRLAVDAVADPTRARFYGLQWALPIIQAPAAWAQGHLGDPGVTVAVVDSGIDYEHVDLAGKVDLSRSVSLVPEDDALVAALFPGAHPVADLGFRGTFQAALIACTGVNLACVAPNVTLVGVKVIDAAGNTSTGRVVSGILHAADVGADVINIGFYQLLSRANPEDRKSIEAIHRAVAYAKARGAAVITQAGFALGGSDADADDPLNVILPAESGALSVSATDRWDQLSPATDFGRSVVDLAAPGGALSNNLLDLVLSACSGFSLTFPCGRPTPQSPSRYIVLSGFPATAGMVSGVAALVDSAHGGALPGHRIESILLRTAKDLGPTGRDPFFGSGRADALAAVEAAAREPARP